jgi:1-acyl-sn-glycerol-3-phosphate acyltransferase
VTHPATILKLLAIAAIYGIMVGPQMLALRFGWDLRRRIPRVFHRLFLRMFHVRIEERGRPPDGGGTLVLSNHVSWLDISVLGSLHPLSFIAKSEVETWPVIGHFARLQRSVFIDRGRKKATAEVNSTVAHRLAGGDAIVLFAEGTTGDGTRLLPFRSSLVGAAQAALADPEVGPVRIQPLAIAYPRRNGLPVTRRERPGIAWYGHMDLAPHLRIFLKKGPLDAVVIWGEPFRFDGDRKGATARAEACVREALRSLRQCPEPSAPRPDERSLRRDPEPSVPGPDEVALPAGDRIGTVEIVPGQPDIGESPLVEPVQGPAAGARVEPGLDAQEKA